MSWMTVLAGALSGMTGAMGLGGGAVLLLYLTLFTDTPQLTAQGINLLFFLPIAALSLPIHRKNGLIDFPAALAAALCGLLGAAAGSLLSGLLDARLLQKLFAGALLFVGLREVFHRKNPSGRR